MRLLQGRDFTEAERASSAKVAIVNASLAREYFGDSNPIGRRISVGRNTSRKDLEIVGVVQDAKYQRLQESTRSIAYLPCAQLVEFMTGTNLAVVLRMSDARAFDAILPAVRGIDSGVPVHVETVADRIRESLVRERGLAALAVTLGAAALLLACTGAVRALGLLGFATDEGDRGPPRPRRGAARGVVDDRPRIVDARRRRNHRGHRRIARARTVRANAVVSDSPTDVSSIAAAAVLMLLVATCAGLVPARRAAGIDPSAALRAE